MFVLYSFSSPFVLEQYWKIKIPDEVTKVAKGMTIAIINFHMLLSFCFQDEVSLLQRLKPCAVSPHVSWLPATASAVACWKALPFGRVPSRLLCDTSTYWRLTRRSCKAEGIGPESWLWERFNTSSLVNFPSHISPVILFWLGSKTGCSYIRSPSWSSIVPSDLFLFSFKKISTWQSPSSSGMVPFRLFSDKSRKSSLQLI